MEDHLATLMGHRALVAALALLGAATALYWFVRGIRAFLSRAFGGYMGRSLFRVEAAGATYDAEGAAHPPDFREDRIVVHGIGGCFPESLALRVIQAGDAEIERIQVGFEKKRYGRLARANPEEIRVDRLQDARRAAPEFTSREDGAGGCEGFYRPALRLPAGADLRLAVGCRVNVDREESFHVVFRNFREGKPSGAASMEVVFRNREPIDA